MCEEKAYHTHFCDCEAIEGQHYDHNLSSLKSGETISLRLECFHKLQNCLPWILVWVFFNRLHAVVLLRMQVSLFRICLPCSIYLSYSVSHDQFYVNCMFFLVIPISTRFSSLPLLEQRLEFPSLLMRSEFSSLPRKRSAEMGIPISTDEFGIPISIGKKSSRDWNSHLYWWDWNSPEIPISAGRVRNSTGFPSLPWHIYR